MKHAFATIQGTCEDEKMILNALLTSMKINNMSVIKTMDHSFYPHGYSVCILLAESHACVHTWPEKARMVIDVFSCNDETSPKLAIRDFVYHSNKMINDSSKRFFVGEIQEIKRGLD